MKIVIKKSGIPKNWTKSCKVVPIFELDVHPSRYSRLMAKVLVFNSKHELRSFWKEAIGSDLGPDCLGATNGLGEDVKDAKTGKCWSRVDRNYFCLIGFSFHYIGCEVISHEATHAGFAYVKRIGVRGYLKENMPQEEAVCYPSGRIASEINRLFYKNGVYEEYHKQKQAKKTKCVNNRQIRSIKNTHNI